MKKNAEQSQRVPIITAQVAIVLLTLLWVQLAAPSSATGSVSAQPQLLDKIPTEYSEASGTTANCRYGVTVGPGETQIIPQIGAGAFYWFTSPYWPGPIPDNDAEVVHLIKTFQKKSGSVYLPEYTTNVLLDSALGDYIRNNPGDVWIVGNEVDRGPNPGQVTGGQGDMWPEMYAEAYHDIYYFIKSYDYSARVVNSGLVQVTPGRLQYLDKVWNAYRAKYGSVMPVDAWSMHVYILPEVHADGITPNGIANVALRTDPAIGKRESANDAQACSDPDVYCFAEHDDMSVFSEQVVAMRQWMKQHGQQQKPLMLTEYSILYPHEIDKDSCWLQDEFGNCFTPDRVSTFMVNSFNYLDGARDSSLGYALDDSRLVQDWFWFGVYPERVGDVSGLVKSDLSTLTLVGETYRDYVNAEPASMNLIVERVPDATATTWEDNTATAKLSVRFRNNGNTAVNSPFNVTFYQDAAHTEPIGSATISPLVRGCALSSYVASVTWSGLTPGAHQFWVAVDSSNVIDESSPDKADNFGTGYVRVHKYGSLLPVIRL